MSDKLTISSETISAEVEKLRLNLSGEQIDQLREFCSILTRFNQHTNLVANCELDVLLRDHVLDSLSLVGLIKPGQKGKSTSLIDIGSGGGFPGLVLAIAQPKLQVALVEATGKKARFLSEAITALSLAQRVQVFNQRAELMAHNSAYRRQFDYATCRAVGTLATVLELALPYLKTGGWALIQRSAAQAQMEEKPALKEVNRLKAELIRIVYPDEKVLTKARAILLFQQKNPVPKIYPRPWPKPKESPLF
jgi:16S rRNA (guanine527-N7)-methyltransferase